VCAGFRPSPKFGLRGRGASRGGRRGEARRGARIAAAEVCGCVRVISSSTSLVPSDGCGKGRRNGASVTWSVNDCQRALLSSRLVRWARSLSGRAGTGEIRITYTHTQPTYSSAVRRPQTLSARGARPAPMPAPLRASSRRTLALEGNAASTPGRQPAAAHAAGERAAGGSRTLAARAAGSGSARSSLRRKRTVQGSRVRWGRCLHCR
jgi:hypothetical protein